MKRKSQDSLKGVQHKLFGKPEIVQNVNEKKEVIPKELPINDYQKFTNTICPICNMRLLDINGKCVYCDKIK